jgi:predicted DNA-binding transcriptional regulator YafY
MVGVRSDRLLAILLLLQTHGRMSATRLAEELEVSPRTILRDMEALSSAGVPVYTERGRNGGIAILPNFRTDVSGLTPDEARALFILTNDTAHGDLGFSAALRSALRKVMAGLPEVQQQLAERSTQRIVIDPSRWGGRSRRAPSLSLVQEAVLTDRQLSLAYEPRDSHELVPVPVVDPHGLVHRGGNWYLVATVQGSDRLFRVDRIRDVHIRDTPVNRPKRYSLQTAWQELNAAWQRDYTTVSVRIRVHRDSLGLLQRVLPIELEDDLDRFVQPPGEWTELTVAFRSFGHARTLLGIGSAVEVIEPAELVTYLAGVVEDLHRHYRSVTETR